MMKEPLLRFADDEELKIYNHAKNSSFTRNQLIALVFCVGESCKIDESKIVQAKTKLHEYNPVFDLDGKNYALAELFDFPCWLRIYFPRGSDRPDAIKLLHPVRRI